MMGLEIQAGLLPSETEAKSALCQGNMHDDGKCKKGSYSFLVYLPAPGRGDWKGVG